MSGEYDRWEAQQDHVPEIDRAEAERQQREDERYKSDRDQRLEHEVIERDRQAAKKAPKPFRSGFCNPNNDAASHGRCSGSYDGRPCVCECHTPDVVHVKVSVNDLGPAPEKGFVDDLDEETYHAHPTSLSVSGAKTLLKAPALYKWERENVTFKKTFEFGSAAHAKVLGIGAEIRVIPDSILASNGATSTKEAKAFIAEARAAGAVPLKSSDARQVDEMADKLSEHTFAMELLSEGRPEVSAFAIDEPTGVLRRSRFDWLGTTVLTDYKTSTTSDPNAFRYKAAEYGYHQQAGWYLDLAADLGHPAEAFAFIVQMKDPPYLVTVVELLPRAVDRGRELNRRALEIFRDCTESDIWPGYVPDTDFARIDLPPRAYYDNEVEITS